MKTNYQLVFEEMKFKIQNNYTITRAKDSDSGIYGCQAENEIGKSAVIETHVVIAGTKVIRQIGASKFRTTYIRCKTPTRNPN